MHSTNISASHACAHNFPYTRRILCKLGLSYIHIRDTWEGKLAIIQMQLPNSIFTSESSITNRRSISCLLAN